MGCPKGHSLRYSGCALRIGSFPDVFRKNIPSSIKAKIKSYPGLNHMFQPCLTGEASEYAQIEQTISPEVLSDIISFIKEL